MGQTVRRWVTIAIAGLLVAGCGGGDDDSARRDDDRPTSTSATSPPTTRSAESEVEQAYSAYKDMRRRLLEAPDPTDAEIARRATGPAEDRLVDSLTTLRAQGEAVRFGSDYAYRLVSIDVFEGSAIARECFVDDADIVRSSTGEQIRSVDVATVLNRVTFERAHTGWRVSDIVQEAGWEGVTNCST